MSRSHRVRGGSLDALEAAKRALVRSPEPPVPPGGGGRLSYLWEVRVPHTTTQKAPQTMASATLPHMAEPVQAMCIPYGL